MSSLELKVYEIFKSKFSEQEAATVIEYFESKAEQKYIEKKDVLATKEDVYELRAELLQKIESSKTDMIKWMFGFFVAMLLAILGLYFKI